MIQPTISHERLFSYCIPFLRFLGVIYGPPCVLISHFSALPHLDQVERRNGDL